MSARTVALVESLPEEHLRVLRDALAPSWLLADGDDSLGEAEVLVVRDGKVDRDVLEAAPALRRIVRIELGDGHIDEEACATRGIDVDSVSSPALLSVGEHAVLAILALLKRLERVSAELRAGEIVDGVEPAVTTQDSYAFNWTGLEKWEALYGKTVGLVGIGRIGSHVARLLRAFGADVLYHKPAPLSSADEEQLGVRYAAFEELLERSDVVSLHNRFTSETERMMDERAFGLMRPGSFFVNTARGRLVDEDALIRALESGRLAGAALDVFWMEPLPAKSPLLRAPNLLLTPHTGGVPVAESQLLELNEVARLIARGD